ncbi:MAG: hypothetical protein JSS02_35590 [Planctomycetes bacterium]|nr:hypothetical protein [Planctomycetota bacterium]
MNELISTKQAYLAMYSFLEELYSKYEFDQLGGLLGSMSLLPDGSPADQAMWCDWLKCVEKSKSEQVEAGICLDSMSQLNTDVPCIRKSNQP